MKAPDWLAQRMNGHLAEYQMVQHMPAAVLIEFAAMEQLLFLRDGAV